MKLVRVNSSEICEGCLAPILRGDRAWSFHMGHEMFMCLECKSKIELREGITDLIALHGGGSLGRQIKVGARRGLVLAPLYILLALIFGFPGVLIVLFGLLGSCTGHSYFH